MSTQALRRADPRLPPGPSGFEAARFFARGTFEGTPAFLLDLRARFGPVTQFRLLANRIWIANDPDAIRDVLVTKNRAFVKSRGAVRLKRLLGEGLLTSEEPLHLRQRRLIQPAFHRERIDRYAADMRDAAASELATWVDGRQLDVGNAMTRLTLAIAARTLFGASVTDDAEDVRASLTTTMELFPRFLSPLSELLDRLPVASTRRFAAARARLDAVIYRMIARRRASGADAGDLLSMLLLARDAEGDGTGMSDEAVRDEAMTIFLAGHETTANALIWTLYLLSQNAAAAARLAAEVDDQLGDRAATAADVARLPFTRTVLAESMRIFPPAWITGRRATQDVEVGGYRMRRNEVVLMAPYVVHRDPRYYDEPEAFRPERWETQAAHDAPKFAYFPFGGGPRLCIGEQFAWMEGVVVLATIARRWRLELAPGTRVDIQPLVTLRPKYPMVMIPRARDRAPAGTFAAAAGS
jgi:cytochrome P450